MTGRTHLLIYGDVIGVGFRAWIRGQSQDLQLTGWVRNTEDKRVEIVAEGEEEKLKELIKKCHQGPEVAWVERVEEEWVEASGEFAGFEILLPP